MQTWLSRILDTLEPDMTSAAYNLLNAVLRMAGEVDPQVTTLVDKAQVLAHLNSFEGKELSANTLRQRVSKVNEQLASGAQGEPLLRLSSSKTQIKVEWSSAAVKAQQSRTIQQAMVDAAMSDRQIAAMPNPISPEFHKPTFRVFVSHGWEEAQEVEKIVDDFVKRLRDKLNHLPASWRDQFKVDLYFDRDQVHARTATFEDQTDSAAQDAAYGVFLLSAKWCASEACRGEASFFQDDQFTAVLLTGSKQDLDAPLASRPMHPLIGHARFKNLLHLWEDSAEHVKEEFVGQIRDEICTYLGEMEGGGIVPAQDFRPAVKGKAVKDLRRLFAQARDEIDVDKVDFIRSEFVETGDDASSSEEQGMPAVDTLFDWARDSKSTHRRIVLLGGFGMGKTTTVQMLAERLRDAMQRDPNVPTPIYLDFRRLTPFASPGEPLRVELGELIYRALHPDASRAVSAEEILDFIRSEPCVVIFDGLDEVGNKIGRDFAAQLYRQFQELIPAEVQLQEDADGRADWQACPTRLLLTCRTHFFRDFRQQNGLLSGSARRNRLTLADTEAKVAAIKTYYMAPFRREQISELFERLMGVQKGAEVDALIDRIHDLPGLASRPIMARFISEVADDLVALYQQNLPINTAAVYNALFFEGLTRDAMEKQPLLTGQDRQRLLEALAVHLHCKGSSRQTADDLEHWFDTYAKQHSGIQAILASGLNARNLLHTELENASFLVRGQDDQFTFAHTSYYEYFLARGIVANANDSHVLTQVAAAEVSRETRDFVRDIAELEQDKPGVLQQLNVHLCSELESSLRQLCFTVLFENSDAIELPASANLSQLCLRELSSKGRPVTWRMVDLSYCNLNLLDAQNVRFEKCRFERTWLAQAMFENCEFHNCSGTPEGLSSARGVGTSLPESWGISERAKYWRPVEIGSNFIPLAAPGDLVQLSPEGTHCLTGGRDGVARFWNLSDGVEVLKMKGHSEMITSVALSADGGRALTGSSDGSARLWDLSTGEELLRLTSGLTTSVAISPDGQRALTGSDGGPLQLWDLSNSRVAQRFAGHTRSVTSVALSPDGKQALSGGRDGAARLWDLASGKTLHTLVGHSDWVTSVAFSPDGQRALTGSDDRTVRLWDLSNGQTLRQMTGHDDYVTSVVFSPNGDRALTGSRDGIARLWDLSIGKALHLTGHERTVTTAAFCPDERTVLTGSYDGMPRLWDISSGETLQQLMGNDDWVTSVVFSPDGRHILSAASDGTVRLWNLSSGQIQTQFSENDWVVSVGLNFDGKVALTVGRNSSVRIWDLWSGESLLSLVGVETLYDSAALSRDGTRALIGGSDGSLKVWDVPSGKELSEIKAHDDWVNCVAFSWDGCRAITGSDDKTARLWDLSSGKCLQQLGHETRVERVALSPEGTRALTGGGRDGPAQLWDLSSGQVIQQLKGRGRIVTGIAFSPDGHRAVTSNDDHTVVLWDLSSGQSLQELRHEHWVECVAFSPDGQHIISGSRDSTARLWDVNGNCSRVFHHLRDQDWATTDSEYRLLAGSDNLWRHAN